MSRRQKNSEECSLDMTPMIDVVFQLMIFFIVTLKQDDILSNLDALRPAPDPNAREELKAEPLTILVGREGLFFQGTVFSEDRLRISLAKIARTNPDQTVLVKCTGDSYHGDLVRALDVCNSVGLRNISVFSL